MAPLFSRIHTSLISIWTTIPRAQVYVWPQWENKIEHLTTHLYRPRTTRSPLSFWGDEGIIPFEPFSCFSPRPATDHCLGKLLPHQLANQTRAPPRADSSFCSSVYGVLAAVSSCCFPPKERRIDGAIQVRSNADPTFDSLVGSGQSGGTIMAPLFSRIYTSLISESGPCLSPSVANHPLGPATDHRLGSYALLNRSPLETPLPVRLAMQFRFHKNGNTIVNDVVLLFKPRFETKLLPRRIDGAIQVRSNADPTFDSLVGSGQSGGTIMAPLFSRIYTSLISESGPCLSPSVANHPLGPATDHRLGSYALLNRSPLETPLPVRLAYVKPAASVHPEPGSNSL
nr:uncharacterized protein ycf68 [Tanacetum cinerariifolium]